MVLLAFAENSIQLVPDGTLLIHLVFVVLMVALLNATLLKPINRILEERERRTKGRLSEAQQTLARVDEKLRQYEHRLREARSEGYALMENERSALIREREGKVAEVRGDITHWLADEKEKLKTEAEQVRGGLKSEAHKMALEITRQILHRPVDISPGKAQG